MKDYKRFINKKTVLIAGSIFGLLIVILVVVLSQKKPGNGGQPGGGGISNNPTPATTTMHGTPRPNRLQMLIVTGVSPADKQEDVGQNNEVRVEFSDALPRDGIILQFIPEMGGKYTVDTKNHII